VTSLRPYAGLRPLWNMVARTAFTQLGYSPLLLLGCTLAMLVAFGVPLAAVLAGEGLAALLGAAALGMMWVSFAPTVLFLELSAWWIATLPVAACLYLACRDPRVFPKPEVFDPERPNLFSALPIFNAIGFEPDTTVYRRACPGRDLALTPAAELVKAWGKLPSD